MNPEHLQRICADYELGVPLEVADVAEGTVNKNYIIQTDEGKSFIKLVWDRSWKFLPYTAAVEELMYKRGVPAVCMLESRSGTKYVEYGEDAYCVYPFIESDRSHEYSLEDYQRMGAMLAKIHKAGSYDIPESLKGRQWTEKSKEGTIQDLENYRATILAKEDKDQIDVEFLNYIDLKLSIIPTLGMDTVLASDTLRHGDYHAGNLLIDKETRAIIGICDWEKAEMAPRAMELARSTIYICFDTGYDPESAFRNAKALLESYADEYPIDTQEIRDGFEVRLRRHVLASWLESHYYDLGSDRGNHFVKHQVKILKDFVQGTTLTDLLS